MATPRLTCLVLNISYLAISYFAKVNSYNILDMSETSQDLDDAHCCRDIECTITCKPVTPVSNALAVIPYDESVISDFHRTERIFHFGDKQVAIEQNWKDVGVAAVVWDAVSEFVFE